MKLVLISRDVIGVRSILSSELSAPAKLNFNTLDDSLNM